LTEGLNEKKFVNTDKYHPAGKDSRGKNQESRKKVNEKYPCLLGNHTHISPPAAGPPCRLEQAGALRLRAVLTRKMISKQSMFFYFYLK
jgi:hypothetical protein